MKKESMSEMGIHSGPIATEKGQLVRPEASASD